MLGPNAGSTLRPTASNINTFDPRLKRWSNALFIWTNAALFWWYSVPNQLLVVWGGLSFSMESGTQALINSNLSSISGYFTAMHAENGALFPSLWDGPSDIFGVPLAASPFEPLSTWRWDTAITLAMHVGSTGCPSLCAALIYPRLWLPWKSSDQCKTQSATPSAAPGSRGLQCATAQVTL